MFQTIAKNFAASSFGKFVDKSKFDWHLIVDQVVLAEFPKVATG